MSRRFAAGDVVRVRMADPPGHIRTPWYVRGHVGVIDRILGDYGNPEDLAYGRRDGAPRPLYQVRFTATELWSQPPQPQDSVTADLFEHWLEPA